MPKSPLRREAIIATAIKIADKSGLEAVTLRGIASRLKVHVTSLYNHIPTKEAVLLEMTKALIAEADLPVGSMSWQDWIKRYAFAMRALALRHPGAFQLFQRGSAQGERAIESLETAIAAFRADGFDLESSSCALRATNIVVLGLVLDELVGQANPDAQTDLSQLPANRYPHTHELPAMGGKVDSFQYLLDILIDGIAARKSYSGVRQE